MLKKFAMGLSLALVLGGVPSVQAQSETVPIEQIVADLRPSNELSDEELAARMRALRAAMSQDVGDETKVRLRELFQADRDEVQRRKQAAAQNEAPAPTPPATDAEAPPTLEAQPTLKVAPGIKLLKPKKDQVQEAEAQAEQGGQTTTEAPVDPGIDQAAVALAQTLLAHTRAPGDFSNEELASRAKAARDLMRNKGVPDDLRAALKDVLDASRQEIAARKAQAEQQQQEAAQPPKVDEPKAEIVQPVEPVDAEAIARAQTVLADTRPANELSDKELANRAKEARDLIRNKNVPEDFRTALRGLFDASRQEIAARKAQAEQQQEAAQNPAAEPPKAVEPNADPNVAQPADAGSKPDEALAMLNDQRDLAAIDEQELRQRLSTARRLMRDPGLSEEVRGALETMVVAVRSELQRRVTAGSDGGTPPKVDPAAGGENKAVETPVVIPEAEKKALAFLQDETPAEKLDDARLRARLETMRNMLEDGDLSRETERLLRQRLKLDREALRVRVALAEQRAAEEAAKKAEADKAKAEADAAQASQSGQTAKPRKPAKDNAVVDPLILLQPRIVIAPPRIEDRPVIIADRRPSAALDDEELNQRIQVYRDLIDDVSYDAEERAYFADAMRADRLELRERMRRNRQEREVVLLQPKVIQQYSLSLKVAPSPRRPPPAVFAAEVDDAVIEQQLIAPPVAPIRSRVSRDELRDTPDVVMADPKVRSSMPGVELDTITFGFNEAFVREEEIADIDRIGRILEKIVAARPNEVFMIEGHTDAVGGDAYNLALSKKRALAVKAALLEFYVIDDRNLATVGLGERYLKIATPDPEEENRRVTIRRVTDLVNN